MRPRTHSPPTDSILCGGLRVLGCGSGTQRHTCRSTSVIQVGLTPGHGSQVNTVTLTFDYLEYVGYDSINKFVLCFL